VSDDALHLLSVAAGPYGDLWAALGQAEGAGLTGDDLNRARFIHETVEGLRREQGRLPLADAILNGCGALAGAGGCFSRHGAWANVRKAARLASAFEKVVPADIGAFLGYLEDREAHAKRERSAGVAVEGADAVRIMSVHAAKGLEFPVVAVADLGHNEVRETDRILLVRQDAAPTVAVRLPVSFGDAPAPPEFERARDERARAELEEAKRVFYVACTRAQDALILSGASDLAKPPPERLAIGWVRAGVGDAVLEGGAPALPGTAVTVVTADDEERLSAASAAPAANRRDAPDVSGLATAASAAAVQGIPVATREHSYTSLTQYRACPYRYYAEHVLGLRPVRLGSSPASAEAAPEAGDPRAFGAVIHAGLQLIAEEGSVDAARLDALARRHALPAGSRDRLALAMEAAERSDVVRRARTSAARAEVPFAVSLEGGLLVGTMDLFAETDGVALIVDFKTGASAPDAAQAAERSQVQAECYAIAALAGGAQSVEVVFVEVERGARETRFTFDRGDEEHLRASVDDTMARVAASRFERRTAWDPHVCGECPAQGSLCRIRRPRRSAV
jgi:ATP-dependent helicase/nuclease subunit A